MKIDKFTDSVRQQLLLLINLHNQLITETQRDYHGQLYSVIESLLEQHGYSTYNCNSRLWEYGALNTQLDVDTVSHYLRELSSLFDGKFMCDYSIQHNDLVRINGLLASSQMQDLPPIIFPEHHEEYRVIDRAEAIAQMMAAKIIAPQRIQLIYREMLLHGYPIW